MKLTTKQRRVLQLMNQGWILRWYASNWAELVHKDYKSEKVRGSTVDALSKKGLIRYGLRSGYVGWRLTATGFEFIKGF